MSTDQRKDFDRTLETTDPDRPSESKRPPTLPANVDVEEQNRLRQQMRAIFSMAE